MLLSLRLWPGDRYTDLCYKVDKISAERLTRLYPEITSAMAYVLALATPKVTHVPDALFAAPFAELLALLLDMRLRTDSKEKVVIVSSRKCHKVIKLNKCTATKISHKDMTANSVDISVQVNVG